MAAHASQIPGHVLGHDHAASEHFAAVYGYEWFVRLGPSGPIDDLPLA